jgi:hypothetical protein
MGRASRSIAIPLEMGSCWGWCIALINHVVLGSSTHVFDDVARCDDATSNGGNYFRKLCDVHLKHGGGEAPMALHASSSHAEGFAAACQFAEISKVAKLQTAAGGGFNNT